MMGYKPEDFFVGVIDFFAVFLPGALLSFVLTDFARHHILGAVLPQIRGEVQGWVTFAFASYLLGHFVFLVGSYVDELYNPVREKFIPKEKDRYGVLGPQKERTYLCAREIKEATVSAVLTVPADEHHGQLKS